MSALWTPTPRHAPSLRPHPRLQDHCLPWAPARASASEAMTPKCLRSEETTQHPATYAQVRTVRGRARHPMGGLKVAKRDSQASQRTAEAPTGPARLLVYTHSYLKLPGSPCERGVTVGDYSDTPQADDHHTRPRMPRPEPHGHGHTNRSTSQKSPNVTPRPPDAAVKAGQIPRTSCRPQG